MVSTERKTFSSFLVPECYFGRAILVITFHSTGAPLCLETSETDFRLWTLQMTIHPGPTTTNHTTKYNGIGLYFRMILF